MGKITPNGVVLEKHENATVVFLTELGHNVTLIPRSKIKGVHTADIKMLRLEWEMKSPMGSGKELMKNTLQRAVKQSQNIIIDLRRVKRYEPKCINEIEREFKHSKTIKRLWIIKKDGDLLTMEK